MTNAHHPTECTKSRHVKEEDSATGFLLRKKLGLLPQVVFIVVVLKLDALNCSEPVDSKCRPQQMKQHNRENTGRVCSIHTKCHPLPVGEDSWAGRMALSQLPHLANPQAPAPARARGNRQRDQPSISSVHDTVTSPLPWPCPSLPEAPAEKEPPGLGRAAARGASTGQAGLLPAAGLAATGAPCKVYTGSQALRPHLILLLLLQNPRVALHSPKCRRKAAHTPPLLPFPLLLVAGRAG